MRIIAIEEHFVTPAFVAGPGKVSTEQFRKFRQNGETIVSNLLEVGDARVAEMDAAGVDMQVLSLNSPGVEQCEPAEAVTCARDANDFLAEVIKRHPKRFAGFASLPIQAGDAAVDELDRCIVKLGFKGANINGHTRGQYLDAPAFEPLLARAEKLDAPIYLHPTVPPKAVVDALYSGFSPAVSATFAAGGWGWHIETAVHLMRMVLGGVFDRHPNLQVVVGHLGEGLPFMLPRMNKNFPVQTTKLERSVGEYLRQNVHYTFGGFNFMPTFLNLLLEVGVDRIMFSVDYPYCPMQDSCSFLRHLPVSDPDRARIAHGNAERLLRV